MNSGSSDDTLRLISTRNISVPAMLYIQHNRGTANAANGDLNQIVFLQDTSATGSAIKTSIQSVTEDVATTTGGGLAFSTGGIGTANERLRITKAGNVGIGTASPGAKLEVGGGTSLGRVKVTGAGTGYTQVDILFQSSTADTPSGRGLGIYTFNEGNGATWFFGNGYNYGDAFVINRKAGASFDVSAAAPAESTRLFYLTNAGNVNVAGTGVFSGTGNSSFAGNVGIGTTAPYSKLHLFAPNAGSIVTDEETTTADLMIRGTGDKVNLQMGVGNSALSYGGWIQASFDNGGTDRGIEALLLNPIGGNVGIGTTNPTNKLQLGSVGTSGYGGNDIVIGNGTQVMAFYQNASASAWYTNTNFALLPSGAGSTGNVGIGTAAPGYKLDVAGTASISSNLTMGGRIYVGTFPPSTTNSGEAWLGRVTDRVLGNFVIQLGGADNTPTFSVVDRAWSVNVFSVNGAGNGTFAGTLTVSGTGNSSFADNVGIGTTAPGAKLGIQGTGSYNSTYWGPASDMSIRSSEMTDSSFHSILQLVSIRQSLTTGNSANGYLGFTTIDDSNGQGMDDAGRLAIVNESGGSRNSPTALSFWTNPGGGAGNDRTVSSAEKMRITSSGNVGIGTTGPGEKLEVVGKTLQRPASGSGYAAVEVIPALSPPVGGDWQDYWTPPAYTSGEIIVGAVASKSGEYRHLTKLYYSNNETNDTPGNVTLLVEGKIAASMVSFQASTNKIQIKNTYGYQIEVVGRVTYVGK